MADKPVLTSTVVVAFVASLLVLLRSFGVPIGDDKDKAILDLIPVAWALGFAAYYALKGGVTPNAQVRAIRAEAKAAGLAEGQKAAAAPLS
jgi:hypothetical protein